VNWEAIGAIGEIIGAIAVVTSLVYLATQIRQSTKVARSATRQAIAETAQRLGEDLIDDTGMAEILVRHISGEELNAVEQIRLQARCYRDMRHWENIHYQMSEGLMAEEQWQGFRRNLQILFGIGAYREYWEHESELYSEAFRKEVEAVIDQLGDSADRASIVERFKR
jgi:hypothetical protein